MWCEILICQCCFCTRIKGHNGRDFLFMESCFYKLFRLDCCLGTMPCGLVLVCKLALCCFFRGAVGSQVLVVYILLLQRCFCFGFWLVFLFTIQSFQFFGDVCKTFHYWVDNYTEAVDSSLLVCPIHDSVLSLWIFFLFCKDLNDRKLGLFSFVLLG